MFKFEVLKKSKKSKARIGRIHTPHGIVDTPTFCPVGTQGTVKTIFPRDVREAGAQMVLANTYHLFLRPGPEVVKAAGGIQKFMGWNGPVMTDSGGFQVFSLAKIRELNDEGVTFQSHIDGVYHHFTPEKVIDIQLAYGSDIILPLDECPPYPSTKDEVNNAVKRTTEWAKRSLKQMQSTEHRTLNTVLFGIVQGGVYDDLRKESAKQIQDLNFPGYGIGGVSVGEPREDMYRTVDVVTDILESDKPRHLLGVGFEDDIVEGIKLGIDTFDCVIPTRLARHGTYIGSEGHKSVKQSDFTKDFRPLVAGCDCYTCQNFSRAYLRHLFMAHEILSYTLLTLHNIRYLMNLVSHLREQIKTDQI